MEEEKKIAEYVLKIRNLIFPPTSYVSGSGARVVVDLTHQQETSSLASSLLSLEEDGAAKTNVGTKIGGFRKIVRVSSSKEENDKKKEGVQFVVHCGSPFEWLKCNYEKVAAKSLVLCDALDQTTLSNLWNHLKNSTCPLLIMKMKKELKSSLMTDDNDDDDITIHEPCVLNKSTIVLAISCSKSSIEEEEEKERRHRGGLPTVRDRTQFQELRKDLTGEIISETGKRIIDVVNRSAALYRCPKGQKLMVDTLKKIVSEENQDDEVVYETMWKTFHEVVKHSQEHKTMMAAAKKSGDNQYYRYSKRIKEIEQLLPRGFHPRRFLDVGCAEGTITAPLGAHFGLAKSEIFGCDIRDIPTKDGMTFQLFDGVNLTKHNNDSCCLVTMLMALHHVRNPQSLLSEVVRVLRPGGMLVIREHDCDPTRLALALDVQHGLYAKVWCDPPEWPKFCKEYFAEYRTSSEWTSMIEKAGLTHLCYTPGQRRLYVANVRSPAKYYWAVYQKPFSERSEHRRRSRSRSRERRHDDHHCRRYDDDNDRRRYYDNRRYDNRRHYDDRRQYDDRGYLYYDSHEKKKKTIFLFTH